MRYNIHLFGRKAVCPKCSGMLLADGEGMQYRCIDCKQMFKIVDLGVTDKEAICESVERKEGVA